MLTESDREILDEGHRACNRGVEAINAVIHKVTDEKLALDLNRQACKYTNLARKVNDKLAREYETPRAQRLDKVKIWTGLQMNTLTNTSNEHVAELMIRGNALAIQEMLKRVKANKTAKKEYCELAEEIMDFEEKCIETLKTYLK